MLDLPSQVIEQPRTEIEQIVAQTTRATIRSKGSLRKDVLVPTSDPLYEQATAMVAAMKNGFHWQDVVNLVQQSFMFVKETQGLTFEEQKHQVAILLGYIIDLTDTPYLPDNFTDPLFKALIPPVIDVVANAISNRLKINPTLSRATPAADVFVNFAKELEETFSDGVQWTDLGRCLTSSITFAAGFRSLTIEDKKAAAVTIVDLMIDKVDMPYLPDNLVDPILKVMVPPLVNMLFDKFVH